MESKTTKSADANVSAENKTRKKVYKVDDGIPCRSITVGGLYMIGKKSGNLYTWNNVDDVSYVEYGDLKIAKQLKSKFVFNPCFVIEDEELVEQWEDVGKVYENLISLDEIKSLYNMPLDNVKAILEKLPKGAKRSVAAIATDAVNNGELRDIAIMQLFDEMIGTDLQLLIGKKTSKEV